MNRTKSVAATIALVGGIMAVQPAEGQILDRIGGAVKAASSVGKSSLTEQDAASGIRAALEQGAKVAVEGLARPDGYLGNDLVKIPFPAEAREVETTLRRVGLGGEVDKAVTSMNRAAEQAAEKALNIFVQAIVKMTIQDAIRLVSGDKNAGTQYLERTTSPEIRREFTPIVQAALDATSATKHWADVMTAYNKVPFAKKINPNLTEYVTDKAMEGLFTMVAQEENNIRQNPQARGSDILKKVFGGAK